MFLQQPPSEPTFLEKVQEQINLVIKSWQEAELLDALDRLEDMTIFGKDKDGNKLNNGKPLSKEEKQAVTLLISTLKKKLGDFKEIYASQCQNFETAIYACENREQAENLKKQFEEFFQPDRSNFDMKTHYNNTLSRVDSFITRL